MVLGGPILAAVERARAAAAQRGGPVLFWASRPVAPPATPLSLLASTSAREVAYWHRPGLEIIGLGTTARVVVRAGEAAIEDRDGRAIIGPVTAGDRFAAASWLLPGLLAGAVAEGPVRPFALGGFRFAPAGPSPDGWPGFPDGLLRVPRMGRVRRRRGVHAFFTTLVDGTSDIQRLAEHVEMALELQALGGAPPRPPWPGLVMRREELPDREAWEDVVADALAAIGRGELVKVVLARRLRFTVDWPVDAAWLASQLRRRYPAAFTYLIAADGAALVGASPELLVRRQGRSVSSFPLAGTIYGGDDRARAAQALTADPKERWEHRVVVEWMRQVLGPVCTSLEVPDAPEVMRAGALLHLGTRIRGRLAIPESVVELAARLHPTPAVGGVPWPEAGEAIARLEGFDRGWYAGPIGWVDARGDGEFALALRCALMHRDRVMLFAGAGIVEGSVPENEARETDLKLRAVGSEFGGRWGR